MENLQELYQDTIKDLYNAEKQFLKAMPKLMKAARNEELVTAIKDHIAQTETHVTRLEEVCQIGGFKPTGKICLAAKGLVEECMEHLEEGEPGPTLDAAIIACAQKNEHYEICSYGTVITWAKLMGNRDAVTLLKQTMSEEEATDELLSNVAEQVNRMAMEQNSFATAPKRTTKRTDKVATR